MDNRLYPTLPTAPPEYDEDFNSYSARAKFSDLTKKKKQLDLKRKKYDKN